MSKRRVFEVLPDAPKVELAAVVAVGCPRYANTEALADIAQFAQSSDEHQVGLLFERTPNRIDWSFSRIVEAFKKCDAQWLVWNDADVLPTMSFDYAYHHAEESRKKGFDVVASPCMSTEGRFNLKPIPEDGSGIRDDGPFEVFFITGGHWWMHKSVVLNLPVASRLLTTGGGYENLYMAIPATTTEDADLCERIRNMGKRIACNPMLLTDHLKISRMPSYRKGMPRPHIAGSKVTPPHMLGVSAPAPTQWVRPAPAPTLSARLEEKK